MNLVFVDVLLVHPRHGSKISRSDILVQTGISCRKVVFEYKTMH